MGNPLILLGILLIITGIVVHVFPGFKLPLLPGDIFIQKEGFTFYFPIVTSILLSIIVTIIAGFFRK